MRDGWRRRSVAVNIGMRALRMIAYSASPVTQSSSSAAAACSRIVVSGRCS